VRQRQQEAEKRKAKSESAGAGSTSIDAPSIPPQLLRRFEEALASAIPAVSLHALAQALHDEQVSQLDVYLLFSHFQSRMSSEDPKLDAVADTMDEIHGGPWAKQGGIWKGSELDDSMIRKGREAHSALPKQPPSVSQRMASRLDADAEVAARRADQPIAEPTQVPDAVEEFSYKPDTLNPAASETEEEPLEEKEQTAEQKRSARIARFAATASVPAAAAASSAAASTSASASAAPAASASASAPTAASLLMSRPVVNAVSALQYSSDEEDGEPDVETVDLAEEAGTSVPILSAAASSSSGPTPSAAASRPPAASFGNFLSRSEQMGFEDDDFSEDKGDPKPRESVKHLREGSSDDSGELIDDVSEEEGEWVTMEEALAAQPSPTYVPGGGQRVRRTLPPAPVTSTASIVVSRDGVKTKPVS
jgi:hypothetical protein